MARGVANGAVFYTFKEASVVSGQWRTHDNSIRPHSSLGYRPPAPEVVIRPKEPSGSVPSARPAIVTRPTMHSERLTEPCDLVARDEACGEAG